MIWAARYVGLPFVNYGRSFKGVDCWGLVQLVMKHENNIDLPTYGETSALDLAAVAKVMARESVIEPWVEVMPNAVKAFDLAVMYRRKDPIHIGIMVDQNHLLHIEEKTDSVIVPLTHPTVAFRNPRFIRHRDLIQHAA